MAVDTYSIIPLFYLFIQNKNEDNAIPMKRYMKNQFEFYGIKSPKRKELTRSFIKEFGMPTQNNCEGFIKTLWPNPHRECQYAALDILERGLIKNSLFKKLLDGP